MTTTYFDWSIRNGVATLVDDRTEVRFYSSLWQVLDLLQPGDRLIGEATFLSFDLDQRARFIDAAMARGITFLTTPTRLTGKVRRREYPDQDKDDALDVVVIRGIAQDPSKLKRPTVPDPNWVTQREAANDELMRLRRSGTLTPRPRNPERFTFTSQKDIQAQEWIAKLPPYQDLTLDQQQALGNGKEYSSVLVAAVGVATKHARNRKEFDHLIGHYAHAYPSQLRADVHHWVWAGGNTRSKLVTEIQVDGHRSAVSPSQRLDGLTQSEYRREVRWLYHQMKTIV